MGRIMSEQQITITKVTEEDIKKGLGNSCRYCPMGMGKYKVESNEGTYYVCEKHKQEHKL